MNVPNHDKVPFKDMTREEQIVILEGKLYGIIDWLMIDTWVTSNGNILDFYAVYRTKPRQLIIPWEHIKPEYKFAVIDAVSRVYFHRDKPVLHFGAWVSDGSMCNAGALNIDTTGIDWRDSLVQRPEGV